MDFIVLLQSDRKHLEFSKVHLHSCDYSKSWPRPTDSQTGTRSICYRQMIIKTWKEERKRIRRNSAKQVWFGIRKAETERKCWSTVVVIACIRNIGIYFEALEWIIIELIRADSVGRIQFRSHMPENASFGRGYFLFFCFLLTITWRHLFLNCS